MRPRRRPTWLGTRMVALAPQTPARHRCWARRTMPARVGGVFGRPKIDLQELVSAAAGCRLRQPTEARYHDHGPLPGFSTGRAIQVLTALAKPLPVHAARYMASSRAFALSLSSAVRADRRNPASRLDWRNVRRRQGRPSHADSELVYWRANTIATDRLVECCVRRTERSGRCG